MSKKKQIKTQALPVPATQQEAESLLSSIGERQRRITKLELELDTRLQATRESFGESISAVNEEITAKFQALHAWAEAHRGELLKGDSKSVKLTTGILSWRTTPPAVQITRGKAQEVMQQLTGARLSHCIRVTSEVNKEAILAEVAEDPEFLAHIAYIKVTSREEFVAKPYASEMERAETVKTTKERRIA